MKINWAWFVPVVYITIPDRNTGWDAYNYGCVVLIRKSHESDRALIEHELVHTKQIIMTLGLHIPLYFFYKPYKYWAELKAYQRSIKCGMSMNTAVNSMLTYYSFTQTDVEINRDLMNVYPITKGGKE